MYIQSISYRPDNATRPDKATGNEHGGGQRSESEGSGATNNLKIKIILTFYHFHSKSYYLAQLF